MPLRFLQRLELPSWFAVFVNGDRGARGRAQLHSMLDAPEVVTHVPVVGLTGARHVLTTLDVLVIGNGPAASRVCTDRGTGYGTPGRGDVSAASATDLMAENTADDPADDRTGHIGAAAIFDDLFSLYPATLLGWTDHRVDRADGHLVKR